MQNLIISHSCLQKIAKEFTDLMVHAQLLFCPLGLLFGGILVAVIIMIVVCLSSLMCS